jgi:putative photosynthetic complex assembly protein 2
MCQYAFPILYALFVWWFSTGLIIYLDGLPRHTFRWSMLGATGLLVVSLFGLATSSADTTVSGAYASFTYGMLVWGWQEVSFLMGPVTGPRNEPCPDGCSGWRHFGHAVQAILYHELAIMASAVAVVACTWGGANQVGTWTFIILWLMRLSAKLNVYLGVLNLNEEFLPEHLGFIKSFLRRKPMNLLFPFSVTISTVIATVLWQRALASGATPFQEAAYTFLGGMLAFGILEHWFLVLPLPSAALWSWSLRSHHPRQAFDVEVVAGFLGAGKTTFLRRTLAGADASVRTLVLVNDFSAVCLDGTLLSGRGADVVELPNGCICCSLRKDLSAQLDEAITRWAPQRILIEPSGVADVATLLGVLNDADLQSLVKSLRVWTVIDAAAFLRDYARMPDYFEAQTTFASVVIVNKADLVSPAEIRTVQDTLRSFSPSVMIVPATYGILQAGALEALSVEDEGAAEEPEHAAADELLDAAHRHQPTLGFTSWSARLTGSCDQQGLRDLLDAVARGAYGQVERVKGIARAGSGWIRFDVAGGRSSMAAFAAREGDEPRVIAIGRTVDEARLRAAFAACEIQAAA